MYPYFKQFQSLKKLWIHNIFVTRIKYYSFSLLQLILGKLHGKSHGKFFALRANITTFLPNKYFSHVPSHYKSLHLPLYSSGSRGEGTCPPITKFSLSFSPIFTYYTKNLRAARAIYPDSWVIFSIVLIFWAISVSKTVKNAKILRCAHKFLLILPLRLHFWQITW